MSEVEKNIADKPSNEDAPKKVYKRNFVFTKARQEAFLRCRKARQECLKKVDKNREIKRVLKREDKLKKKKEELGLEVEPKPEPVIHFPESNPIPSSDDEEEIPSPPPKQKRKSKPKVIIQEDSSSEEEEVDQIQYIIKRVSSRKPKADKYIPPPNQQDPIYTNFNTPTSYFL